MLEKNTTLLFFGPFGYRFIFPLVEAMRREFALGCVLVGGGFDLSRPHTTKPHPFSGDIEVVCPEPQEIAYALSDESPEAAYQRLATMMVERAISVHTQNKKQVQGQIIILVDMYIAPYLSSQIRELKTRLPRQTIVCVTELPELAHRDERVDEAYVVFAALHKERDDKNERIVETTLVLDSHAAVATAVGIEQQDRLAGKSHACGVIGHLHSMHNPTFAEAARRLGNHTAFSGLSVATAHVATGNSPKLVKLVEWLNPKASKRGFGDVQDMVTQIRTTTRRVFDNTSNPSTKASEGTIDTSKPSIAIVTAPMKAKDPRYAEEVSGAIRSFYKQTYPRSSLILVPGGGTVDKKLGNGFFTQVACWYPFDPVGLSASPAQSQATRERLTLVPVESESASNTVNGSPQRIASSS